MKKLIYIGIIAVTFTACATYQKPLIDDAYYWPDKHTESLPFIEETPQTTSNDLKQHQTRFEYLNVQDTTVTIRIKR